MNFIRNLVHWKVMIVLAIIVWVGISKVAASDTDAREPETQNAYIINVEE